jgi:hypothetical protein
MNRPSLDTRNGYTFFIFLANKSVLVYLSSYSHIQYLPLPLYDIYVLKTSPFTNMCTVRSTCTLKKKVIDFPVSPAGMSLTKLSLAGNNLGRENR